MTALYLFKEHQSQSIGVVFRDITEGKKAKKSHLTLARALTKIYLILIFNETLTT